MTRVWIRMRILSFSPAQLGTSCSGICPHGIWISARRDESEHRFAYIFSTYGSSTLWSMGMYSYPSGMAIITHRL